MKMPSQSWWGLSVSGVLTIPDLRVRVTRVESDTTLAGHMGRTPLRDNELRPDYKSVKCHDANGELYSVTQSPRKRCVSRRTLISPMDS
jgi:hypothetical protein